MGKKKEDSVREATFKKRYLDALKDSMEQKKHELKCLQELIKDLTARQRRKPKWKQTK